MVFFILCSMLSGISTAVGNLRINIQKFIRLSSRWPSEFLNREPSGFCRACKTPSTHQLEASLFKFCGLASRIRILMRKLISAWTLQRDYPWHGENMQFIYVRNHFVWWLATIIMRFAVDRQLSENKTWPNLLNTHVDWILLKSEFL